MYPGNFLRLVVAGAGDGGERWSWSLSLNTFDNGPDEPDVSVVPAAVIAAVEKFHKANSTARAKLDSIKLNEIGVDGKYVRDVTVEKLYATADRVAGSANLGAYPAQVALAVTLRTDVERGLANRGRFFIPYPGVGMGTDGMLTSTTADFVATSAKTLIDELNAAGGWDVCVASDTRAGALRRVMRVQVGRRFDVIRSRGRSLLEQYSTAAVTPT